ncbi:MAG: thioredoxin family protein [Sulfurimonas sp.]|jgi:hypothetical protein
MDSCSLPKDGAIINEKHFKYPLYEFIIYGNKVLCQKLSKRINCAAKKAPIRLKISYIYDTQKAIDAGISVDPTALLDGKIFIEGLKDTQEVEELLLLINKESGDTEMKMVEKNMELFKMFF